MKARNVGLKESLDRAKERAKEIRSNELAGQKPIAVIGATWPAGYQGTLGFEIGFGLRRGLGNHILTGGVSGVGSDVWLGVATAAKVLGIEPNFSTLMPEYEMIPKEGSPIRYELPDEYLVVERSLGLRPIDIRAGQDMMERRTCLSMVAHTLVMANGGRGTLEEAALASQLGRKVIVVNDSGGAANALVSMAHGEPLYDANGDRNLSLERWMERSFVFPNVLVAENAQEAVELVAADG